MIAINKRIVSIDIGNSKIKLVHGQVQKEKIIIYEYDVVDTPEYSVEDGKLLKVENLINVIKDGIIKKNKIKCKNLVLTITGTGVIVRDIQIPKSTEEEIDKILEFEVEQYFPVGLENYVLDYKVVEQIENVDGVFYRVLIVAVPNNQVDEYMKIHNELGMDIEAIDIPVNAIQKLFFGGNSLNIKSEKSIDSKEFAVLDFGAKTTGVYIFSDGSMKFNRILLSGSKFIDESISNNFNLDFKESEDLKISSGELIEDNNVESENESKTRISDLIKGIMGNMLNDVNRFFEFYNSRRTMNKLRKIYICGGGSQIKGLDSFINLFFNIPVENIVPMDNIIYKGKKTNEDFKRDFPYLVNCIGSIVRSKKEKKFR
ncbi:UNVERIFIED_CONTAM: type IV pilus assembly protein PilM [Acetivibrio alkalicellulosi]